MAKVKQLDIVTGSIGKLSFYTRKGSDTVIVRTKGGAKKNQIKSRPEFEKVRQNNKEFGGCSRLACAIRDAFSPLKQVADYNVHSSLCALAKEVQKGDTENPVGQRSILLSASKSHLTGLDFNRTKTLHALLKVPLEGVIVRSEERGSVTVPAFHAGYALDALGRYSMFRITAVIGLVCDHRYNATMKWYEPLVDRDLRAYATSSTEWYSVQGSVPGQTLSLAWPIAIPDFSEHDTLLLSVGVEFGELDALHRPTPIKGAGAGRVIAVG